MTQLQPSNQGRPETTSTRLLYLAAWLRIGDPPLLIRRVQFLFPWIAGITWLVGALVGKPAFTAVVWGFLFMCGSYFADRVGPRRGGGPYHPIRPISRVLMIAIGFLFMLQALRTLVRG